MGSLAHNLKVTMWKVILVTGGNKGIGLAIVGALLQEVENSIVLLGSRDGVRGQQAVDGVVAKLGKQFQPRVQPILIDVTNQESVDKAAAVVKRDHGKIFGVINNAGGSFTGLRATIDLNAYGVLCCWSKLCWKMQFGDAEVLHRPGCHMEGGGGEVDQAFPAHCGKRAGREEIWIAPSCWAWRTFRGQLGRVWACQGGCQLLLA